SEIMKDAAVISIPSWVPKGIPDATSTKQGKGLGDQWRFFCTVNLVIMLTHLWGVEPSESWKGRMLENFLHLISAVKYASLQTIDDNAISAYERHMATYLETLLDLYPGTHIVPNQHFALHFGDHLWQFGPIHSWHCFALE
ncbi:hypothetical protein P691DRAFT_683906, partial [Macrolepiota fuliginosa MF-IS2]